MPLTPPPVGWSTPEGRKQRLFEKWLKQQQRNETFKLITIIIGITGILLFLLMYLYAIAIQTN